MLKSSAHATRVLAAVLSVGLSHGAMAQPVSMSLTEGGVGISDAVSSNPSAFTGININTFLGADAFYNVGITGQNAIVANVEAGHIWSGHETLGHVTSFSHHSDAYGTTTADLYDRHATWVGMLIGGRTAGASAGEYQRGIAYGATLRSGALASAWSGAAYSNSFGFTVNSFIQPYNTYFGTADVINSSWGFTDASGTNVYTTAMDGFANQSPQTTFVVSAGNSGSGANTVGAPGSGYNAITVAALANNANQYDVVASFSSRSPQSWGTPFGGTIVTGVRAAVDIAAPGASLTSAFYGGQTGGNNTSLSGSTNVAGSTLYSGGINGTSFAAPIVAGAATLMHSYSNTNGFGPTTLESTDARLIKAVMLNAAEKNPSWSNGQTMVSGVVETTQSLDWATGAGMLDIAQTFTQYTTGTTGVAGTATGNQGSVLASGWDYGSVAQQAGLYDNTYFISQPLAGGSFFTATLVWFRDRAFNPVTTSVTDSTQANLNLYVFETDSTGTLLGSIVARSISTYNVVEHLHFTLPADGYYGIAIDHAGALFGTAVNTLYGLAWSGTVTSIPEPATLVPLLVGLIFLSSRRRSAS